MTDNLKVDWCSYEAAKYAVERWHYSKTMPASATARLGVWEAGQFIGCVLFSKGHNRHASNPYGLLPTECCELTRIALTQHEVPVSKVLSIAIKMLKEHFDRLRLIISYADAKQGHLGIIYQASNWIYIGTTQSNCMKINDKIYHKRAVSIKYGTLAIDWLKTHIDEHAEWVVSKPKHKYLYPLDKAMRRQVEKLRKTYPVRTADSSDLSAR